MKRILAPIVLLTLLVPSLALGVDWYDLVEREGLNYEKFSDVPFTGRVTGESEGFLKNGKIDGIWRQYYSSGQLWTKGTYKDGKSDGPSVMFHENGQLWTKGTYKDGKIDGLWVSYYEDGQLQEQGTYKDGKMEGPWVFFNKDGIKRVTKDKHGFDEGSGTYRNGKKISD